MVVVPPRKTGWHPASSFGHGYGQKAAQVSSVGMRHPAALVPEEVLRGRATAVSGRPFHLECRGSAPDDGAHQFKQVADEICAQ